MNMHHFPMTPHPFTYDGNTQRVRKYNHFTGAITLYFGEVYEIRNEEPIIHWEVNPQGIIVGYKLEGDRCYWPLSQEGQEIESMASGYPGANRREARKLGLLRSKSSEAERERMKPQERNERVCVGCSDAMLILMEESLGYIIYIHRVYYSNEA